MKNDFSKFQNKYRVPSTRLKKWDYSSAGYYFVTICTKNQEKYFGEIMQLSEIGNLVQKYWLKIPNHFPFVVLDTFIIMPNHIHGILIINNRPHPVETPKLGVSTNHPINNHNSWKNGCLGVIINQFKRICTIDIRKKYNYFSWQPRFYDQIIKNEKTLWIIRKYIEENPKKWKSDKQNPCNLT